MNTRAVVSSEIASARGVVCTGQLVERATALWIFAVLPTGGSDLSQSLSSALNAEPAGIDRGEPPPEGSDGFPDTSNALFLLVGFTGLIVGSYRLKRIWLTVNQPAAEVGTVIAFLLLTFSRIFLGFGWDIIRPRRGF